MSYISFNGQPKPGVREVKPSLLEEGNYIALETSVGRIWAHEDPGEYIQVHVAEKRRTGVLEDEYEPVTNIQGALYV